MFSKRLEYFINTHSNANTPNYITLNNKKGKLIRVLKDSEKLRTKLSEMQEEIDKIRDEITNDKGKYSNKDLVTKRKLSRNQRIYSLSLYEIGATHQVVSEYNTSTLFQHRMHYYLIPRGEKK